MVRTVPKHYLCIMDTMILCMYLLIMEVGVDFYKDSLSENRAIKILVLFERKSI